MHAGSCTTPRGRQIGASLAGGYRNQNILVANSTQGSVKGTRMPDGAGISPLLQGIALGATICCSLGPQSIFVLRQGIHGKAAFAVAAICSLADILLIIVATAGAEAIILLLPQASRIGVWGGAIFLAAFGCLALAAALRPHSTALAPATEMSQGRALAGALAISLLNPQVYVEMVMVVGGISLMFPPGERALFGAGVALVSPLWFFGLATCGRNMARLFAQPCALFSLDLATGFAMLALAASIIMAEV